MHASKNSPTASDLSLPGHLPRVPAAELQSRATRLAAALAAEGLDSAFLLHPSSHFWISGTLADGYPLLTADGRAVLPLRASVSRSAFESPLPQTAIRRPADLPDALRELEASPGARVGLELDVVPVATFERLRRAFPDAELVDASRAIREARSVKSEYEIEWIERAAENLRRAMDDSLPKRIVPGVREIELMAYLEGVLRAGRHQGIIRLRRWNMEMYYGVVSSGASASFPCYFDGPDGLEALYPAVQQGGGERAIEPGVPILVDFVGAAGGYLADRTRVFCLGTPPSEAARAHEFCLEILAAIEKRLRPGAIPAEVYDEISAQVAASPWADGFMGWAENQVRFLGHGIGLDLDELPVLAPRFETPFAAGHVIAVEPKVFLGEGGGVGVENTYVITDTGCRNLTPGPEEIRVLS